MNTSTAAHISPAASLPATMQHHIPDATITINRAGWMEAAREQGLCSVKGVADSIGLDVERAEKLWSGELKPDLNLIASSLKLVPATFSQLFRVH